MKYQIFNKSSAEMPEIADASVGLIFTSPPYNIGTRYGEFTDDLPHQSYQELLQSVFRECARVIKHDGLLVVECADSVVSDGVAMALAGYIGSLCLSFGFKLKERHINFINSQEGVELCEHGWKEDFTSAGSVHSNAHQIFVFSKSFDTVFDAESKVLYLQYPPGGVHPCPTPKGISDFVLGRFYKSGMLVLDPFAGTAQLGAEVLVRGGQFIGYEIDAEMSRLAELNLASA